MNLNDLTEAAARAQYEAAHDPAESPVGGGSRWATWDEVCECPEQLEREKRRSRAAVLAVLNGLMEPSEEQIGAGGVAMFKSDLASAMNPREGVKAAYTAMLSTLLQTTDTNTAGQPRGQG